MYFISYYYLEISAFNFLVPPGCKIIREDKDASISTPLVFSFSEQLDILVWIQGRNPLSNFIFPSVPEGRRGNNE